MIDARMRNDASDTNRPFRILHMEDDAGLARLVRRKLLRERYQVDLATDGEQGIAMYQTDSYDLLLLDHYMPVYNGIEVLRALSDRGPLPPTIMITGRGDEKLAVEAMKLGASDYVVKDPDGGFVDLLPTVIARALANHRLQQEKVRSQEALREARDKLECHVNKRTEQLAVSNEQLRTEMQVRKRAEAELKASEERFRAIFETASDCIYVKDRALRYTQVNPAMANLLSIPALELVGKTCADLFDRETSKHIEELDLRVLDGQPVERTATRWIGTDLITFHDVKVPLRDTSGKIVGLCGISRDVTGLKRLKREPATAGDACQSLAMKKTIDRALSAAHSESTVLLLGESGSGKDYLAQYIHDRSSRSGGPFFAVNCAAVATELAEAELFGHEAGAFTGAGRRKRGLLELAEGGTLLLNEIGDLPLPQQAKLLSFLDTRSFTRVGGETNIRINARIIAATNCDLHKEVKQGRFRLDLFYRLNVLSITVPPLRERREDLPLLVRRIVNTLAAEMQLHETPHVGSSAMRTLVEYDWPGNIRQLRNVIERALILSRDQSSSLSFGPLGSRDPSPDEWSFTVKIQEDRSVNDVTNEVKRALIAETLARSRGNKQVAAQRLGISRFALFRMMKALGMSED